MLLSNPALRVIIVLILDRVLWPPSLLILVVKRRLPYIISSRMKLVLILLTIPRVHLGHLGIILVIKADS